MSSVLHLDNQCAGQGAGYGLKADDQTSLKLVVGCQAPRSSQKRPYANAKSPDNYADSHHKK